MEELSNARSASQEWSILIGLSAFLFAALQWLHVPAALLLASMLAGIATSTYNFRIRVPVQPFMVGQV